MGGDVILSIAGHEVTADAGLFSRIQRRLRLLNTVDALELRVLRNDVALSLQASLDGK